MNVSAIHVDPNWFALNRTGHNENDACIVGDLHVLLLTSSVTEIVVYK